MIRRFPHALIGAAGALCLGFGAAEPAAASSYASLAHAKVYMREGPTYQHRVLWLYQRKNLPVQVLQSYDVWRKIRDPQGTVGWVHTSMLSDKRTVVVTSTTPARIRNGDGPSAPVVALAQHGVVAELEACEAERCEVRAAGTDGWIRKQDVWGVDAGEVFK